jgi:hypothetical protein
MTGQTLSSSPADRIALLLSASGITEEQLAQALGLPAGVSAHAVLVGDHELSPSDLVVAADLLDVPVTVLSGHVPLDRHLGVSLRLGTVEATDVPVEALRYADELLRFRDLLDSWLGRQVNPLAGVSMSTHRLAKKAGHVSAQRVRDGLGLGEEPLADLVGLAEELGFPVAFRPLPSGVCGFNVRDEREGTVTRLIIISTLDPWTRQRYTLAHEICHGLYDDDGQVIVDLVDVPDVLPELRAESFARHLLIPAPSLRPEVTRARARGDSWQVLTARVMVRWGISRAAALRALVDDELADPAEISVVRDCPVDQLMAVAGLLDQWRELSAGQSEPSGSPLLVGRALEAFSRGLVGVRTVAELLGQDVESTRKQLVARGWALPEPASS